MIHSQSECNCLLSFRETRYYKIEFDFKSKNKEWPIHKTKEQHVCEIGADKRISFEQVILIL